MKTISFVLTFGATWAALADGLQTWQWRSPLPHGNTLETVIYSDGRFLAVGFNGAMMTSTNGAIWDGLNSETDFQFTVNGVYGFDECASVTLLPGGVSMIAPRRVAAGAQTS